MKRNSNFLIVILFIIYLVLLVWIILFKLQFSLNDLDKVRSVNLIPFYYKNEIGFGFHIREVVDNILIFAPMGIYAQMLLSKIGFLPKMIIIAGMSFCLEAAQYICAIGRSDITDFLTNTIGGLLGIALYLIVERLFKSPQKANKFFAILAIAVSVSVIGLLTVLLVQN